MIFEKSNFISLLRLKFSDLTKFWSDSFLLFEPLGSCSYYLKIGVKRSCRLEKVNSFWDCGERNSFWISYCLCFFCCFWIRHKRVWTWSNPKGYCFTKSKPLSLHFSRTAVLMKEEQATSCGFTSWLLLWLPKTPNVQEICLNLL